MDQSGEKTDIDAKFMYYVNDGVYSSFNCLLFDHATVHPKLIKVGRKYLVISLIIIDFFQQKASCGDDVATVCSIWGPTCDSMDCVMEKCVLPELEIGDWLYFESKKNQY